MPLLACKGAPETVGPASAVLAEVCKRQSFFLSPCLCQVNLWQPSKLGSPEHRPIDILGVHVSSLRRRPSATFSSCCFPDILV